MFEHLPRYELEELAEAAGVDNIGEKTRYELIDELRKTDTNFRESARAQRRSERPSFARRLFDFATDVAKTIASIPPPLLQSNSDLPRYTAEERASDVKSAPPVETSGQTVNRGAEPEDDSDTIADGVQTDPDADSNTTATKGAAQPWVTRPKTATYDSPRPKPEPTTGSAGYAGIFDSNPPGAASDDDLASTASDKPAAAFSPATRKFDKPATLEQMAQRTKAAQIDQQAIAKDLGIENEVNFDEPLPTRTMARLLATQGHGERAISIYEKLLSQNPDDTALSEELETLRLALLSNVSGLDQKKSIRIQSIDEESILVSWRGVEKGKAHLLSLEIENKEGQKRSIEAEIRDADSWIGSQIDEGCKCWVTLRSSNGEELVRSVQHLHG